MPSRLASNFVLVCCLMVLFSMPAHPQEILSDFQQIGNRLPVGTKWALHVFDFNGATVFAAGAKDERLVPGSVLKLLITGAGVQNDQLEWPSAVLLSEKSPGDAGLIGNIYLRGSGNALFSMNDLERAIDDLYRRGLRRIEGAVIADETFFHVNDWILARSGAAYAFPGALGLDLHTVRVTVRPAQSGEAPQVFVDPPNDSVRFAIAARTIAGVNNSLQITQLDDRSYKIVGTLPVDAGETSRRFVLSDPALYAAEGLKTLLEKAGIIVGRTVRKGKTPEGAVVLKTIPGPQLEEVLRNMNHHSLNLVADNLLLALGAQRFGPPGTREKGAKAVEEFLSSLDLPMDELRIYDGSGLSDQNRVSANFMARYLYQVSQKPWFPRFKSTLPRPGFDGTVKTIGFSDERFRVKSGQLEDVYALSGYGVDGSGKNVAFCFIVNGQGVGMLPTLDQVGADVLNFIATERFH